MAEGVSFRELRTEAEAEAGAQPAPAPGESFVAPDRREDVPAG